MRCATRILSRSEAAAMLRTVFLIFQNEFHLLVKDRVGLFMLILAPVVIITVAGFSLGNLYGARASARAYLILVVDDDHGAVAQAVIDALRREPSIVVTIVGNVAEARGVIIGRDRAPLAILIPAGTTEAIKAGRAARLIVYVAPVKRLEVSAIAIRLGELCRNITARAQDDARRKISSEGVELRAQLDRLAQQLRLVQAKTEAYRQQTARSCTLAHRDIETKLNQTVRTLQAQTQTVVGRSLAEARSAMANELAPRREALLAVNRYLMELQSAERDFDHWLNALKTAAGSHAADIPPPPRWPTPPPKDQLAVLAKPIELTVPRLPEHTPATARDLAIRLPALPPIPDIGPLAAFESPRRASPPMLPGNLGVSERSLTGGKAQVNTFDQYVPGFGITFLLIGMLLGVSLGLIDDRDWGTLERLRASGASLAGTLIGKLLARFLVGLMQMVVLFSIGWWLFSVSLGQHPVMLLLPAVVISFAAAAFSLIIACVARTHDAVMPIGAVVSMAMSAIGGCWWPLDFEPSWMRELALWVPTTWTMQAFNDLMIRNLSPASALRPSAAAFGLSVIYLIVGIFGASRVYD
jgi:ABC-type multidrug transport system permease subunit